MTPTLCGQLAPRGDTWRCTRPAGHEGDHIAGIGPYVEGVVILTRWPPMTQTWWLSFGDADKPKGEQLLGIVVVDVDEADVARAEGVATALRAQHGLPPLTDSYDRYMAAALWKTHRYHCNPGGSAVTMRIDTFPGFATYGPRYPRNQLLSRAEVAAIETDAPPN